MLNTLIFLIFKALNSVPNIKILKKKELHFFLFYHNLEKDILYEERIKPLKKFPTEK